MAGIWTLKQEQQIKLELEGCMNDHERLQQWIAQLQEARTRIISQGVRLYYDRMPASKYERLVKLLAQQLNEVDDALAKAEAGLRGYVTDFHTVEAWLEKHLIKTLRIPPMQIGGPEATIPRVVGGSVTAGTAPDLGEFREITVLGDQFRSFQNLRTGEVWRENGYGWDRLTRTGESPKPGKVTETCEHGNPKGNCRAYTCPDSPDYDEDRKIYEEVTGRDTRYVVDYQGWYNEYVATGMSYPQEQMEALVTDKTYSKALDGEKQEVTKPVKKSVDRGMAGVMGAFCLIAGIILLHLTTFGAIPFIFGLIGILYLLIKRLSWRYEHEAHSGSQRVDRGTCDRRGG